MSSPAGHVTTETVFGQTLALQLGNGDEHPPLESDTTGLNVKGNLYFYFYMPTSGAPFDDICLPAEELLRT